MPPSHCQHSPVPQTRVIRDLSNRLCDTFSLENLKILLVTHSKFFILLQTKSEPPSWYRKLKQQNLAGKTRQEWVCSLEILKLSFLMCPLKTPTVNVKNTHNVFTSYTCLFISTLNNTPSFQVFIVTSKEQGIRIRSTEKASETLDFAGCCQNCFCI